MKHTKSIRSWIFTFLRGKNIFVIHTAYTRLCVGCSIISILLLCNIFTGFAELKTYSSPGDLANVPNLKQSSDYTITVNGKTSFVYETENTWDGKVEGKFVPGSIRSQKKAAFTNFDFKNETVTVQVTCNFTVNSVNIRPKSDSVAFTRNGNVISFTISKSKYLSVEVNDRLKPLFIFADSIETPPTVNITYGPGIHVIGPKFVVPGNQKVYIAGGAVVVGSFYCTGNNFKIYGRGLLNGGAVSSAEWQLDKTHSPLSGLQNGASGYEIHGITMVNAPGWHINAFGGNQNFSNVKCIGWAGMTDGPHLNGNGLLKHCFIFNNDDCLISNIGSNNTFIDNVVWKGPFGRCMVSLANNDQSNVVWDDVDVIGNEAGLNVFHGKMMAIIETTAGLKQNFTFKNIRIEAQETNKAGLICINVEGTAVVKNINFENISTELLRTTAANTEGTIKQFNGGIVDGVHFKFLRMNGVLVDSLQEAHIQNVGAVPHVDFDNTVKITPPKDTIPEPSVFKILANKSTNTIDIKYGNKVITKTIIYNSYGAMMNEYNTSQINITNFSTGIYIARVEIEGQMFVGKFLRQ